MTVYGVISAHLSFARSTTCTVRICRNFGNQANQGVARLAHQESHQGSTYFIFRP